MKFAMCNEFCVDWSVQQTCKLAAETGFEGVEIAPFTLASNVFEITAQHRKDVQQTARRCGLEVVGLHWLLAQTQGLHISHPDQTVRQKTAAYYEELILCCAEMGGGRMIHGSPQQRGVVSGQTCEDTWARTVAFFQRAAPVAREHNVMLCIEPLARGDADFINTKDEAVRLINEVNHPNFQLILDCKAMVDEDKPIPQIIGEAKNYLQHFHANDDNLSYPGSGSLDFAPILAALHEIDYQYWVSIEVFDFTPPPPQIATEGLAALRQALGKAKGYA